MKNNVSLNSSFVDKIFDDEERFLKESVLLKFLSNSHLSSVTPLFLEESHLDKDFLLKMSRINGCELSIDLLTECIVHKLGSLLAKIHLLGEYDYCGSFNNDIEIENGHGDFNYFILAQVYKWAKRLLLITKLYKSETEKIINFLIDNRNLFTYSGIYFCHNDFDLKNVIISNGKISGIIDWEFAGAYTLCWEIRKIIPIIFWNVNHKQFFINGYKKVIPSAVFPNRIQQSIVVVSDCIGALGWAYKNNDELRIRHLEKIFNKFLDELNQGGKI